MMLPIPVDRPANRASSSAKGTLLAMCDYIVTNSYAVNKTVKATMKELGEKCLENVLHLVID
jgi:hypothetical protein